MISNLNGRIILEETQDFVTYTITSFIRDGYRGNSLLEKIYETFPINVFTPEIPIENY